MASDLVAGQKREAHRVDVLLLVDAVVCAEEGKSRRAKDLQAPSSQRLPFLRITSQEDDCDTISGIAYTKKDALTRALFNFLIKSDLNSPMVSQCNERNQKRNYSYLLRRCTGHHRRSKQPTTKCD